MLPAGQLSDDDLPLPLAPFCTVKTSYQTTKMSLFLASRTGAAVSIDTWLGRLSIYYDDVGADFCPWAFDSAERSALLDCFPTQFVDRVEGAVREVWQEMMAALALLVERKEMIVIALAGSPLTAAYSEISEGRWRNFRVDDWETGRAICPQTGELLFDVHFRPSAATNLAQAKPLTLNDATVKFRDVETLRHAIEEWRQSNEERPPGARKLQEKIESQLGAQVSRTPFREAYLMCFPDRRNAPGRPRKRN